MADLIAALQGLFEPLRFGLLVLGVLFGLAVGVIPGIGGLFALTLLVPLTYTLDPMATFALLLGMASVTTTSDTVPAVLFGIPGTVGSAATVVDGHELAKQGQADRALGAAYMASLLGGLFGAILLAASLGIMRPLVLLLDYGDLLAITIFGLTLVALLSEGDQIRGLLAAVLGVLVAFIGLDPYEGAERWTFGELYLWDGVPVAIVFLGLFGVSEMASVLERGKILRSNASLSRGGLLRGMGEALTNWRTVLTGSSIGSILGAVPGVGVTVIEWIAYGVAARKKSPNPPFGKGNIVGVIGPESANNAKEGGGLLPTLAFGIPGSATMAILLGAFTIHGLVPGPRMLSDDAPLLISMILTIAIANVLATGLCLGLTPMFARIAAVPATTLVPMTLVFVVLGAFNTGKDVRDLVALLIFGAIGIAFKKLGWSRPAFALGFVLGPNLERFFVLTYQISGWAWLTQPGVLVILAVAAALIIRRAQGWKQGRGKKAVVAPQADVWAIGVVLALLCGASLALISLPVAAKIFPSIALAAAFLLAFVLLVSRIRSGFQGPSVDFSGGLKLFAMCVALALAVLVFGKFVGAAAFIVGSAIFFRAPSVLRAGLNAGGVVIVVYLIFNAVGRQSWPDPWAFVAAQNLGIW